MEHWNTTDGENEVERQRFRKDLDGLALEGARRMITAALGIEVEDFLDRHRSQRGEDGRAPVVRNGYGQLRQVTSCTGPARRSFVRSVSNPTCTALCCSSTASRVPMLWRCSARPS